MNQLLGDTSYWVALVSRQDQHRAQALKLTAALRNERIVTTDVVLIEFLNFLCRHDPHLRRAALGLTRQLLEQDNVEVVRLSPELFEAGLLLYERWNDKRWSQTDCISIALMRQRGISTALTADHHFEQAGFTILLK